MNTDQLTELTNELQKIINRTVNNHVLLGTYMNPEAVEKLAKAKELIDAAVKIHVDDLEKYNIF